MAQGTGRPERGAASWGAAGQAVSPLDVDLGVGDAGCLVRFGEGVFFDLRGQGSPVVLCIGAGEKRRQVHRLAQPVSGGTATSDKKAHAEEAHNQRSLRVEHGRNTSLVCDNYGRIGFRSIHSLSERGGSGSLGANQEPNHDVFSFLVCLTQGL